MTDKAENNGVPKPEADPLPGQLEDFLDARKIFSHPDRVYDLWKTGDTRPIHMTVGLTNYCNHKCPWCYINWAQAGKNRIGDETLIKGLNASWRIVEAVAEAKEMGLKAVTIVGDGEPLLHPRIAEILDAFGAMGLDIGIFSNLGKASEETLQALVRHCFFIRASIDAASADVHQQTHGGGDFETVIANLSRLLEIRAAKRPPVIGVQFVTNQWNFHQLPEAARLYRDLGVDYMSIKPAYKNVLSETHPTNEIDNRLVFSLMKEAESFSTDSFKVYAKYPQFVEVVEHLTNDARHYKKCLATPLSPYLDEDGNVEMCGNLKGRGFTLGNVNQSSFAEIWNSQRRQDCLSRIDLFACPSGCRLHPLNKALWDAFNPERLRRHPNFL